MPSIRGGVKASSKLVSQVCALTDPFCGHAVGAKYPDQTSARTITESLRMSVAVPADANGNGAIDFSTSLVAPYSLPSSQAVSGQVTWGPPLATGLPTTLFATYGTTYRVVTAGVRILNTSSATNSSGYMMVGKVQTPSNSDVTDFAVSAMESAQTFSLEHGLEVLSVFKPKGAGAQTFYTNTYEQWDSIAVIWTGAPVGATLVFELVVNYEFIIANTSVSSTISSIATPSPPDNPLLQSAASAVTGGISDFIKANAQTYGRRMVALAAGALAARLGGPQQGLLAYSAANAITVD